MKYGTKIIKELWSLKIEASRSLIRYLAQNCIFHALLIFIWGEGLTHLWGGRGIFVMAGNLLLNLLLF